MSLFWVRVVPALILNAGAAVGAWYRGSVSRSGAVTGFVVAGGIYLFGGFRLWALLMVFFVAGSVASRIGARRKMVLDRLHEKGSSRDGWQVVANGGPGLAAALGYGISGHPAFAIACAAAFAAAAADTLASEIGFLSRRPPVSVLTGRPLPPGTSGGVSVLGSAAAAAGAAVIAATFVAGWVLRHAIGGDAGGAEGAGAAGGAGGVMVLAAAITAAGVAGSFIDSVLGATVQAHYADRDTGELTERPHTGGAPNRLVRGVRGFNNDVVNALSGLLVTTAMLFVAFWGLTL